MKRPAAVAFWLLALLGVFLSAIPAGAARGGGVGAGASAEGRVAPDFTLTDTAGAQVALSDLRGTPVLVNFWATWCPDCRLEMPELQRFRSLEAGRVTIVGIDEREPAPIVTDFLRRFGFDWTFLLDTHGTAGAAYDLRALPTSYFLDASGIIRQVYTGPMTLGQMKAFLKEAMR